MSSVRYREYWYDRFGKMPINLALVISVVMAAYFDAVRFVAMLFPSSHPLLVSTLSHVVTSILSGMAYFLCTLGAAIELIEWHDKRVYEKRFTDEERKRLKVAHDMAFDYMPKEPTETDTEDRDRLRIERYECECLEWHLRKRFTPLNIKAVSAENVREKKEHIAQELYERFYPKEAIDSVQPHPSKQVSVQTALLLRKALALVPNDDQLKHVISRMQQLSS